MCLRVGILGTERRTEGIDISEGHREGFHMELSGYGQRGMLAEEVFGILAVISGGSCKDFTGTFRIIAGDDRCMDIDETLVLEELMDRHG